MHEVLLSFGVIIFIGLLARRLRIAELDADSLRSAINSAVLNIFMPALCVKILYGSKTGFETLLVPVAAWIITLSSLFISVALISLLGRRMSLTSQEMGVMILAATFGNVTYLGLPVLTELYGQEAAQYALFYDLLATSPIVWTFGAAVAARYGEAKGTLKDSVKAVASLPPVWGIAAGMVLNVVPVQLPGFLLKAVGMLGDLVIPLMIFTIGLSLSLKRVKRIGAVIPAIAIKFFLVPAVAYATARLLGLTGIAFASCFLEGAMPSMIMTIVFAERFKLDVGLAALIVAVTTALSFFSLPVALHIAENAIR